MKENTRLLALFVIGLIVFAALLLLPEFTQAEATEPPIPRTLKEFNAQAEHYSTWTPIGFCVESVGIPVPGEPDLKYEYWIYNVTARTFRQGDEHITDENIQRLSVQYTAQHGVMDFVPVKWVRRSWSGGNVSNVVVLVYSIDKTSYEVSDYHRIKSGAAFYELAENEWEDLGDVTLPQPPEVISVYTDDYMHDLKYWGMCSRSKLPFVTWGYPSYPVAAGANVAAPAMPTAPGKVQTD